MAADKSPGTGETVQMQSPLTTKPQCTLRGPDQAPTWKNGKLPRAHLVTHRKKKPTENLDQSFPMDHPVMSE